MTSHLDAGAGMRAVALVLDPRFGTRTATIAQQMPVWIVSSEENNSAVQAARLAGGCQEITVLLSRPNEGPQETLERALFDIDEHCGEVSQSDPYDTLWVYGAASNLSPETVDKLGFRSITSTAEGFIATKL